MVHVVLSKVQYVHTVRSFYVIFNPKSDDDFIESRTVML